MDFDEEVKKFKIRALNKILRQQLALYWAIIGILNLMMDHIEKHNYMVILIALVLYIILGGDNLWNLQLNFGAL